MKEPLKLDPIEDLKKTVAALAQVPKDGTKKADAEPIKPRLQRKSPKPKPGAG
jgi:hypothetical protein